MIVTDRNIVVYTFVTFRSFQMMWGCSTSRVGYHILTYSIRWFIHLISKDLPRGTSIPALTNFSSDPFIFFTNILIYPIFVFMFWILMYFYSFFKNNFIFLPEFLVCKIYSISSPLDYILVGVNNKAYLFNIWHCIIKWAENIPSLEFNKICLIRHKNQLKIDIDFVWNT